MADFDASVMVDLPTLLREKSLKKATNISIGAGDSIDLKRKKKQLRKEANLRNDGGYQYEPLWFEDNK